MIQQTEIYKLAEFGHSTGFIQKMGLNAEMPPASLLPHFPQLLAGANPHDDAYVLEIGHGEALVQLTDFATPSVNDPFQFGRIATANALNRIYATGGEPVLAAATLGWPSDQIPAEAAELVLEGSRSLCLEAGIPLDSGHRIESAVPFLGLAVTGKVRLNHLKQNNTATEGNCLYLTKPLGYDILITALQQELLNPEQAETVLEPLTQLNSFGAFLGKLPYVKAVAQVSGAGLLGHLLSLAESSGLSAEIDFHNIPVLPDWNHYLSRVGSLPTTESNWEIVREKLNDLPAAQQFMLAGPQPNGGLLIAVDSRSATEFERVAFENKLYLKPIGQLIEKQEKVVYVR